MLFQTQKGINLLNIQEGRLETIIDGNQDLISNYFTIGIGQDIEIHYSTV